ncbi:DUF2079 domain-containing protein [Ktedonobacter sp. SOSP1-52]|uniref:DUF2079 domain-containing protein n=1 Tax=Ktedonobacter sp. SOSP1-52 TaxID=2778366 RepID=UPI001915934B|nr:DUF2079 domain-containing protein [Ktedonobacter sp. SOSP1-52]
MSKRVSIWQNRLYLYPRPEPLERTRLFWVALGLVTTAVVVFSAYFILLLTTGHSAFGTNAEDLGIMDQAIWNLAYHGELHQTICNIISDTNCYSPEGINRFAIHFEPILWPISWLYYLWADPRMLLIFQTVVVALGPIRPSCWPDSVYATNWPLWRLPCSICFIPLSSKRRSMTSTP